jgi:hypothetical protein
MSATVGAREWYQAFRRVVQQHRWADPLRTAALAGQLGAWTEALTGAVAAACQDVGWAAAALGHAADALPVARHEFLAIDVMAFPATAQPRWAWPVAAFELENRLDLQAVSYALWKVSVLRCALGGVFCYRQQPHEIGELCTALTHNVMRALFATPRRGEGDILLVVGTRSQAETFPDGFFRPYLWQWDVQAFRRLW